MILAALLCFGALNPGAFAQTAERTVEEQEQVDSAIDVAPVTIDGEDLFMVVGVSANPAEERATDTALRIVEVAEKGRDTPSLRVQETEFGPAIHIDGIYIMTVTQLDVEFDEQISTFNELSLNKAQPVCLVAYFR